MKTIKMNGLFVRKSITVALICLLGTAFLACSDDESTLGGGAAEETRGLAFENIELAGRAMLFKGMSISEGDSAEAEIEPEMVYDKADLVTAYELDSVTFEKTGVEYSGTVYDNEGSFKMEKASFKSPYVLVTVEKVDGCNNDDVLRCETVIETVADLSETKNVNVNVLTSLAARRTLELAATGVGLDSAKRQAEREVLESFYIFEKQTPFDELSFASTADKSYPVFVMANYLFSDYTGEIKIPDETQKFYLGDKAAEAIDYAILSRTSVLKAYGLDSSDSAVVEKAFAYLANYSAVANDSLELCDESKQGKISTKAYWPVQCNDGLWEPAYELPHEFGTLVDERDGKVYKTVVIEIDGVKQTWMAENLNFADTLLGKSWCYDQNPENCEVYGRLYSWNAALNTSENMNAVVSGEKEFAPVSQGICPDGWRLPTVDDWYVVLPSKSATTLGFDGELKNPSEENRAVAALKSHSWYVEKRGMSGRDLYGFAALPAGRCEMEYDSEDAAAAFLSGETDIEPRTIPSYSGYGMYTAFAIGGVTNGMVALRSDRSQAYYLLWGNEAVSVRCIKD